MLNGKRAGDEGEHREPAAKSNGNALRKNAHKESFWNQVLHNASSEMTHNHESGLTLLTQYAIEKTWRIGQDAATQHCLDVGAWGTDITERGNPYPPSPNLDLILH